MTRIVSTTTGLYPLPDTAKEELSDLKGNQKEDLIGPDLDDETEAVYDRVRASLIETQADAGLDQVVEGQARWDDMLAHPLAVHEAVETRGIVRYYDNNNFYREPVVTDELTADGDVAAELDDAAAGAFPDVETLFLLDPSLVENPPRAGYDAGEGEDAFSDGIEGEAVTDAIDTLAGAVDAEVVVYPYWGALDEKTHAHVLDADVDALGYDLVSEPDNNVYNVQEYGTTDDVALGLVDGQNTLVESPETVRERVDWFTGSTPSEEYGTVYAVPNTELFYLPENKVEAKLETLANAAHLEVTA
ncbi:MAG: 5-methyltetrahydropteroyltriglutamate--homocysteine methyltransferase [Halobacteriales archaeon SW_8_66_22]|nr:MAG: 5-methyltetrahydropteroyltriglutamate--homocysteine methyltransferase [Halobacteriales archaeon SW_8_66_22]